MNSPATLQRKAQAIMESVPVMMGEKGLNGSGRS
jgi:hypothetical protein